MHQFLSCMKNFFSYIFCALSSFLLTADMHEYYFFATTKEDSIFKEEKKPTLKKLDSKYCLDNVQ
jgi:hypothetical protein